MCSASRSARRPTASVELPLRSTPTTPVPARPRVDLEPERAQLVGDERAGRVSPRTRFPDARGCGGATRACRRRARRFRERCAWVASAVEPCEWYHRPARIRRRIQSDAFRLAMSSAPPYDLLVIGGGINGAGIARDAAGRGLSVLLAEQDDLASRHVVVEHQADPRRPALPRVLRIPAGGRGAGRARSAARERAAHHRAARVRAAARAAPASGMDDPHRPVPLRSHGRPDDAAEVVRREARRTAAGRAGLQPRFAQGLRLRGCARRRRAAGRRQCARRAGARRRHPRAHARRPARGATAACGARRCGADGAATGGDRARARQRRRAVGEGGARQRAADARRRGQRAPRQGQPHRRAARASGGARVHPAERRQPHRVRDPVPRRTIR